MTAPTIPQIVDTLGDLRRMGLENCYPADLWAARRGAFLRLLHDPDRVTIKTPPVSEEQDERNSREFPY
jgi:hypothetical protein